jgi:segregation and condensation protein B
MELKSILESILFSSQKALSPHELRVILTTAAEQCSEESARALKKVSSEAITTALEQLEREHEQAGRSYRLVCVAGAWQFVTQPDFAPWVRVLHGQRVRPPRLTQPALETLAIIAYRQPVTRAEIEQVRGVAVDGVVQTLQERGLIHQTGRAEVVGRPALYGTTALFLEYFGLRSLEDLPAAVELRRLVIQKPAELLTVEPGLATAPPEQLTLTDNTQATNSAGSSNETTETGQSGSRNESSSSNEASRAQA